MAERVTRRSFIGAAGAAAVGAALPAAGVDPADLRSPLGSVAGSRRGGAARVAAISSANGLPAVTRAVEL
ncbi:MAG: twin-arginine translocation signal domain-containing protein, partial [Gemmatimonadales bacterium]|nr:twin-arginine translocation signal domain-containing protein [Gemmatimonadales bacterium]